LFNGENPIGKRISLGSPNGDWHTIIGVVADVRQDSVTGTPERGAYDLYGEHWNRGMYVVVRASAPANTLIASIRARVHAIDPELPVYEIATMDERAAGSIVNRRFLLRVLGVFSTIALVLSAVGIYGVTSEAVGQRRRELGIRIALGATGERIQRGIMTRALVISAAGIAAGVVGTLMMTGTLRALMYGVAPTDLRAFAGAVAVLVIVTLLAAWLPAYRASRADPVDVLRTE
jgi:predicted lysophospholipase L1 biosynthesis ABC-type transport system permease subunit